MQSYNMLFVKYFLYSLVLERYRFIKFLTRVDLFYYILYIIVNIFCNIFRISSIANISTCTKNLFLINVILSYLAYYLNFISDMLNLSLQIYRIIYITIEIILVTLELIYTNIKIAKILKLKLFQVFNQLFESLIKSILL